MFALDTKRRVPSPALVNVPAPVMGEFQSNVKPLPTLMPPPPVPSDKLTLATVSELSRRKTEPLFREIEVVDGSATDNPPG